ncbi:MAG: hypothetical protein IJT21_05820 [Synergistaceae bacterium]|nr:hypothetical protein [Synergistaceae bacterium]
MNRSEYNLTLLTPESTLLFFLRTLFGSVAEYAVYIPDSGDVIALMKEQLVSLVERGCADSMVKTLPQLVARNIVRPVDLEEIDYPDEVNALYVTLTGSFISTLEAALYPDEPVYPEWWEAPVPFAISSRGNLRLNDTAKNLFGSELERLNAYELPDKDEFIVTLDSESGTRFIAFKKLKAGIYSIDDCTEDLNDAQDITWWAAVGQAWTREIESQGGKWQRLDNPPEGKSKTFRACEWHGELQGYLNIQMPPRKKAPAKKAPAKKQEPEKISTPRKPDDVITNIGPQAMALLAAGQLRDHEGAFMNE